MSKSLVLVAAAAALLMACKSGGEAPQKTADYSAYKDTGVGGSSTTREKVEKSAGFITSVQDGSARIRYADEDGWDEDMETALKLRVDEVVIDIEEEVTIEDVPGRLDAWISNVKRNGGDIQLERVANASDPNTRSVGAVISLVRWAIGKKNEGKQKYKATEPYSTVLLTYDETSNTVKRVTFYR